MVCPGISFSSGCKDSNLCWARAVSLRPASLLLSLVALVTSGISVRADVFVVTNTSSSPWENGSLPWALNQANNNAGFDTINFDIPGSGPHIINMGGQVLWVNDKVHINGNSQPG